jgi:flagellar protein FlgJ
METRIQSFACTLPFWSAEAKLQQAEAPLPHSDRLQQAEAPLPHSDRLQQAEAPLPHSDRLQQAEAPLPHSKTTRSAANPALLRACKEFESLFVLQLWRAMQRTVPNQSKTLNYTEMFDVQFADHLSRQGRFGLAEQLYEQLSRHLPDTGGER